jgi:integrating conjugative element protein (TIGR03757 family)
MVALTGLHVSVTVSAQQPIKTEVFTLSTIAMTNTPGATIYYVDGISQIQNFLSAGLPRDPTAAQAIAKERWGTLGRQGNQRLQNAGVGLGRAVQLGINRVPAVVFDDRAIVYGVTDVAYAAQIYRSRLASGAVRNQTRN